MIIQLPPLAIYERIRDRLEQVLAMLPHEERATHLRLTVEEAIEAAAELAFRRQHSERPHARE